MRPFYRRKATAITRKISNESLQYSLKECRYNKLKTRTIISPHRGDNLALIAHINSVISLYWSCNPAYDVARGIVGSDKMVQPKYFHLDQFAISQLSFNNGVLTQDIL